MRAFALRAVPCFVRACLREWGPLKIAHHVWQFLVMSLLGNYETASVYYQGVIQQIHRMLATIEDPGRKLKWQQIQGEVAQEYDVVKNITQTLALFKGIHFTTN